MQHKTYWYLAKSNARLKISHTTSRCELTSSKATGQKCREVGLLSVRQPVSGSSDSFSAPWVCLLLNREGGKESGEKRKQYSIHTVKKLNLIYPEIQHIILYLTEISDEVFMLNRPKCILCTFFYLDYSGKYIKKMKILFAFCAKRKREML